MPASRPYPTRTTPSTPVSSPIRPAPPTLEQLGILPGSSLLATPEEAEEREQEQRRMTLNAKIALLDNALTATFACRCCGGVAGPGALCPPCRLVAIQLQGRSCRQ